MDVRTIVPATDIVEGSVANTERSTGRKRIRGDLRPLRRTGRACRCRRGGWCSSAYAGGCECLAGTDRRGLPTRRIAPVLVEVGIIFLHADQQLAIIRCSCGIDGVVDELEGWCAVLIQRDLIIQGVRLIVILGAPFDVEDAVWRGTSRRSKDATGVASDGTACSGALVTPIRSVHIRGAGDSERRACNPKAGGVHAEGQVAVRPCVSSREGLVIQCDRERKCNRGVAIIAMAADVVHARHEGSRV